MGISRRSGKPFLFFVLLFWLVHASVLAQDAQSTNQQATSNFSPFPSGFQVEVSGLVRSMHSELMNLESQLERTAEERDALYATNISLQKKVASLERKNDSRFRTGLLLGAAVSTIFTGVVCCACLTVALK